MSGGGAPTSDLRVAIVGAGPAGLYAAVDLLKRDHKVRISLFDRLPTIGGLIRSGVSPDHHTRQKVIAVYERLAIASRRFDFYGNVEIGRHVSHRELCDYHHAVIHASGAPDDRALNIAGEDLPGSHAASEFVGWYNAHPEHAARQFDLSGERTVIVGNGNVALDIARILLTSPDRLRATDIADPAVDALTRSGISEVVILGRRGPAQASFTAPELLELDQDSEFDILVDGIDPDDAAGWIGLDDARPALRLRLLREYALRPPMARRKRLIFRFLTSPVEIIGTDRVQSVRTVRNELLSDDTGILRSHATDRIETLPTSLIVRSLGYHARQQHGAGHDRGRVLGLDGSPLRGVYIVGWLKRGASGVIGSNKVCSQQTVASLLDDAKAGRLSAPCHPQHELAALIEKRQRKWVDYQSYQTIDREERRRGAAEGRPRVKFASIGDMLAIVGLDGL
jgi:ferredoxin/flavodoxin---NADP+ reductase